MSRRSENDFTTGSVTEAEVNRVADKLKNVGPVNGHKWPMSIAARPLKFDVAHPDRRPGDFHNTLYRDEFPTMEPLEILKEICWGGFLATVAVALCVGIGYGGAWLINHYGVSFRQLMKLAQGWLL